MLLDIHATWAWVVITSNAFAGFWTLLAWKKPATRSRAQWWFVAFAQAAVFVQVGLGAALYSGQGKKVNSFHIFYGFVALMFIAYLYTARASLKRFQYPAYGFGGLFIMGLGIRALLKA